ncbi:MAG: ATP phosphoribosyltransferase regulatory subunit [Pseudomonadota bacterium]|nr:ATP phosphoribosyltransferase regulatory subunit [Pseudomonadota bacterium]
MTAESATRFAALEAQAARIMETFNAAGYEPVAPAILQPAGLFLDQIGEAVRSRTYVFTDNDGEELCLRPDLTIPVCRLYLERHPEANVEARYCYNGPAFRYQPGGNDPTRPREFRQAGVEFIGGASAEHAEAEVLALALEALRVSGLEGFQIRFGDLGLFAALVAALDIPDRWRERLRHFFWRAQAFRDLLRDMAEPSGSGIAGNGKLLRKIDPADPEGAQEIVSKHLARLDIPLFGERTLGEIAERLIDKAADIKEAPLPKKAIDLIEGYLAVDGPPRAALARIDDLVSAAGIDLNEPLTQFQHRLNLFAENGVDLATAQFSAEFGRDLEYYTGLVYQVEVPDLGRGGQVAGGGRYDSLLTGIGASARVPAVGAAIHTERLLAMVRGEGT